MTVFKYIKLPFYFENLRLQKEVFNIGSAYWQMHYQKLHYEGGWSAIPLRSIGGKADDVFISPHADAVYQDTIFLQQDSYIAKVLSTFKFELQAVRLLKLDAHSIIKEHKDAELSFEHGSIRLHIPVITHDEVVFLLDKERMNLKEGECWYMNFNLLHSIHNNSSQDRIHLVIDALVNDWIKEIFQEPSVFKKEIEKPIYDAATKQKIIAQLREMNTEIGNRLADEMETDLQQHEQ